MGCATCDWVNHTKLTRSTRVLCCKRSLAQRPRHLHNHTSYPCQHRSSHPRSKPPKPTFSFSDWMMGWLGLISRIRRPRMYSACCASPMACRVGSGGAPQSCEACAGGLAQEYKLAVHSAATGAAAALAPKTSSPHNRG